jgi:hypothetical protein
MSPRVEESPVAGARGASMTAGAKTDIDPSACGSENGPTVSREPRGVKILETREVGAVVSRCLGEDIVCGFVEEHVLH